MISGWNKNEVTAVNYCGIDLGKMSSHYCIMDRTRKVLTEKRVATNEEALRMVFKSYKPMKIVIESSTKGFWVADVLTDCGHEVVVVDPRKTKAIGSGKIKHDKLDARVLATLCQADLYAAVHRPSRQERHDRMTIVVRDSLVRSRTLLINPVRSLLDSEGIEVPGCDTERFTTMVRERPDGLPAAIAAAIEPLLESIDGLCTAIADADVAIKSIVSTNEVMKRFQTVDGVGPIVAASFFNAIRDPARFRTSRQVGTYLGLVPSLEQSSGPARLGRITKLGNRQARHALTGAAGRRRWSHSPENSRGCSGRCGRTILSLFQARPRPLPDPFSNNRRSRTEALGDEILRIIKLGKCEENI